MISEEFLQRGPDGPMSRVEKKDNSTRERRLIAAAAPGPKDFKIVRSRKGCMSLRVAYDTNYSKELTAEETKEIIGKQGAEGGRATAGGLKKKTEVAAEGILIV
jgi:hypothetical protein